MRVGIDKSTSHISAYSIMIVSGRGKRTKRSHGVAEPHELSEFESESAMWSCTYLAQSVVASTRSLRVHAHATLNV